ncbi:hypothetical protein AVEN_209870-1 [Araneus ventricosus]|uniref:Histone-lysine N-methyltransferase SETMAR n=1 Tax=Araneus ventricosus TaxID=182803 RepID=A0A4Y2PXJ7_ARAVE|nr:hypothetical protein AVEN_209870-1 [Araneus ventricosus]
MNSLVLKGDFCRLGRNYEPTSRPCTLTRRREPRVSWRSNVVLSLYVSETSNHFEREVEAFLRRITTLNETRDNARPHAAQAVADLFDRWGCEVLYHPPYSPDLSPCDFDFIPNMEEALRGIRFRTVPEILQAVDRSIRTINTTGAAKCILQLPHRCWQRVVHNAGDYNEEQ